MKRLEVINCKFCNKPFQPKLSKTRYCSRHCSGKGVPHPKKELAYRWKGGIHRRIIGSKRNQPSGYIEIWIGNKWIGEHRLIIQNEINRVLKRGEHVHHINGIRNDNRRENLILLTASEHNHLEKPKQVLKWNRDSLGKWI